MRQFSKLLIGFIALIQTTLAQSSVWKISNGENSLYLGGTSHILRSQDYPLPPEFEYAYKSSEKIVFEVEPSILNNPQTLTSMMQASVYTDGTTLESILNQTTYQNLKAQSLTLGIPIQALNTYKPGMVASILTIAALSKYGITEEGVEIYFEKKAIADNKKIASLETVAFQINLLTNAGTGYESEFIHYSLKDIDRVESLYREMIAGWKNGDLKKLDELLIVEMQAFPQLYSDFIVSRNHNWIPQIETMLTTPQIEFVLFGVGHAPGKDGIIQLLLNKGYKVQQIRLK